MGSMELGQASTTSLLQTQRSDIPDGRLWVPPAYYQTTGDAAIQLDSASDMIAVRILPQTDFLISAISRYVTALVTEGDGTLSICADSTAPEPNGELNGSDDVTPTMTAADAPSPYVVRGVLSDGVTATDPGGTYAAWILFGGGGTYWTARDDAFVNNGGTAVDKGGGLVGLPSTAHPYAVGQLVQIINTTNYDGVYTLDAATSADEIVITATYVGETFGSNCRLFGGATEAAPVYLTFDNGSAVVLNRYAFKQVNSADGFPLAWTLYGSNESSPDPTDSGDWSSALDTESSVTGPGALLWKEFAFTNGTAYRHYMWAFTGPGGNGMAYAMLREVQIFEAEERPCPGAEIQELGTLGSGDTADVWTRLAVQSANQYQAQRGVPIWLVMTGAASADWSESIRRPNEAIGSAMPDEMCLCKTSTDGGILWTQALQNSLPAMWNVVINSVESDHVPQLCYGRYSGQYLHLPGVGMMEIPEEGAFLDCSARIADTLYYAYAYSSDDTLAGTFTLELSTTAPTIYQGVEVKTGATTYRYLGMAKPKNLISTHQGPVFVEDTRNISNRFNRLPFSWRKPNVLIVNTYVTISSAMWTEWDESLNIECVCCMSTPVCPEARLAYSATGPYVIRIRFDSLVDDPQCDVIGTNGWYLVTGKRPTILPLGAHSAWPISMPSTGTATTIYTFYAATNQNSLALFQGEIEA